MSGEVTLSGLVVCQDNAGSIGAVLRSLGSICDETVVVDGGSTDGTDRIAGGHPRVRLYRRSFDGNISSQKNFGMDQCLGKWILLLDTDEVLESRLGWKLRGLILLPGLRWYSLPRRWLVPRGDGLGYLAARPWWRDRQVRLFRNLPELRYDEQASPIHHDFQGEKGPGRPLRSPCILHSCLLELDRAERERKVARYGATEPGSDPINEMYLYEDLRPPIRPLPAHAVSDAALLLGS